MKNYADLAEVHLRDACCFFPFTRAQAPLSQALVFLSIPCIIAERNVYEKALVGAGFSGACFGAFVRRLSTAGIAAFEAGALHREGLDKVIP